MRLKNKIGDRSNASSEVEYHDAVGYLIGEHGRGVKTIMEMVALTRLDCATGSAGIMRSAVFSAGLHVSQRKAFGKRLLEQPSMACVLADLEVECEAATHMSLAAAAALGADAGDDFASCCLSYDCTTTFRRRKRGVCSAGCAHQQVIKTHASAASDAQQ
jgi:putative acyl-CoA dehydrogenase